MKLYKKIQKAVFVIWAATVAAGILLITDYAVRPGRAGHAPSRIPSGILKEGDLSLPTVLVIAHPHCACSRATIRELGNLVSRAQNSANFKVLFYQPSDEPSEWVESDLWRMASEIPGVVVSAAPEAEFDRFGAATSGQVFLYDASGNLVFSGGITSARGHEGGSNGRAAIEEYFRDGVLPVSQTPVFGCALSAHTDDS